MPQLELNPGKVNFEVSEASVVFSLVTMFPRKNFCVNVDDAFYCLLLIKMSMLK